jgi:hypothetical protein
MVKQSTIKTTTWADQAQGFDFPSKQHTARGRTDVDETAEASHPQGKTGRNGNRYASLDETSDGVWNTTPSQDDSNRSYRSSGRGFDTSQRREVYGRGGGRGRGRQHRGPSTIPRGGAPIPLPPYATGSTLRSYLAPSSLFSSSLLTAQLHWMDPSMRHSHRMNVPFSSSILQLNEVISFGRETSLILRIDGYFLTQRISLQ